MAKQTIVTFPAVAKNSGSGTPLADAFKMINDNFDELYTDDAGDVNSVNGQTGTVVLDTDDITEGSTNEYYTEAKVSANTSVAANTAKTGITSGQASEIAANTLKVTNATHSGDVSDASGVLTIVADAITTGKIINDAVTYDKMGGQFTTSAVISALDVDFSTAQVFTKTLTAATTLTFSNEDIGMVKDLIITPATFALTLPAGGVKVAGTYATDVVNFIQIVITGASTYYYSVSQAQ